MYARPPGMSYPRSPDAGECHVWLITDKELTPVEDQLNGLLNVAERDRAARYRDRIRARLFVLSRAAQRVIAGRYLDCEPAEVVIDRRCEHCGGGHGRPRIAGAGDLDFSVTYGGRLLLLAYVVGGRVGIDAEPAGRDPGAGLGRMLAPAEAALLAATPEPDRTAAALRLWTRKEAALKLTGRGLALPPRTVDVTVDRPVVAGRRIALTDLSAEHALEGHAAAVATTEPISSLTTASAGPLLAGPVS
jgi:4'-phosphopantetheinyl transferase